jgi:hypothetical protein
MSTEFDKTKNKIPVLPHCSAVAAMMRNAASQKTTTE